MRIGIVGAQSTGKSTLAKALAKELDLPLISEQARSVAQEMGISDEDALRSGDPERGIVFQKKVLERQVEAEAAQLRFISDRTTIDNAVYWLLWDHARATPTDRRSYIERARMNAQRGYSLLIYVPVEFAPAKDGFRMIDPDYQREVDFWIRTLIKGWGLQPWMEVRGSVSERVQAVLDFLASGGHHGAQGDW